MGIHIFSDNDGETEIREAWSDAARSASAAARAGRGKGLNVRKKLGREAYRKGKKPDLMDIFQSQGRGPVKAGTPWYSGGKIIGYTTDKNGSTGFRAN